MFRCIWALVVSCLIASTVSSVFAQKKFSSNRESSRSIYSMSENGVLTQNKISLMGINDGFDLIQLLDNKRVRLEIEATPEQLARAGQIRDDFFSKDIRGKRVQIWNKDSEAATRRIESDLTQFRTQFAKVFSPEQIQRLEQILNRKEFQQSTIAEKLQFMMQVQEIEVSQNSIIKFYQLSMREGATLARKCEEFQRTSFSTLFDVLSDEQQREIRNYFEHADFDFDVPVDVFIWQCRNLDFDDKQYEVPDRFQKYSTVLTAPLWEIQIDGIVGRAMTSADSPGYRMSALMSSVFDLIREQSVGSGDAQWNAIHDECESLRNEYHDLGHRLVKRRTEMGDRWNDKHQEFYYQKLQGFCLESLGKVEAMMTHEQQANLIERIAKRRMIQFGLPASLLNGELGERLEITDSQTLELKAVCEKIVQDYEQFAKQAYQKHFDVMMEAFSEKEIKAMDELIGKPLKGWKPAVGFWAHRLTRIGQ